MALIFCDSFEHYATADLLSKWTSVGGANAAISSAAGRFVNGLFCDDGQNPGSFVVKGLPSSYSTLITGFALRFSGAGGGPAFAHTFFAMQESGTVHVDLRCDAAGHLQVTRNGTTLGTGTTVLSTLVWYYVEIKVTVSDTVGAVTVNLNGVAEITVSGVDTRNGGSGVINQIKVGNFANNPEKHFDDLYVCDTSGSAPNNDFLGDVRVEALFPNGNGNSSQFTGSDGNSTDNYLLVDDATPNGDTDYVADGTVTDKDTYAFGDATPSTGTVYGVQISHYSRKTDAGTRSTRSLARLSATETDNGSDQALSTSYIYYTDMRETKPGGGAWSLSDVNSAEFGVKVAA